MTRESLIQAGIDYDDGVKRFANKAQIYEKYLLKFFESNSLVDLQSQLEAGDYESAFRTAHGIKGVCGNLSMGELYDTICELMEFLRGGGQGDEATRMYRRAIELYHKAEKAVEE